MSCSEISLTVIHLQLLLDCSELESRLSEMLILVNSDDYGKDQMATQNLSTKHQVQQKSEHYLNSRGPGFVLPGISNILSNIVGIFSSL